LTDLEVEVHGTIRKAESGYQFDEIAIHPKLTISRDEEQSRGWRLLEKTKRLCLVSRALAVPQKCEPEVHVMSRAELAQPLAAV